MGAVYEARQVETGARVAVKIIHEHLLEGGRDGARRFRREARMAASTESEHLVRVLDAGDDDGLLYLVMEYLEGEDLQHLVDRLGPLAPDVALRIAAQALAGLQEAHEAFIIHRDIKPANIFLARRDGGEITVKILDFGIAKIKADPMQMSHTTGLTETDEFLGSPLYMSPEQVLSSRDVDHRTDLWSLGSTIYCALAGKAPHGAINSVGRLVYSICSSPPPPLTAAAPWVPPEVAAAIHGALQIDLTLRPPTAAAMREAIVALLPEGTALHERMLVPVDNGQRAEARRGEGDTQRGQAVTRADSTPARPRASSISVEPPLPSARGAPFESTVPDARSTSSLSPPTISVSVSSPVEGRRSAMTWAAMKGARQRAAAIVAGVALLLSIGAALLYRAPAQEASPGAAPHSAQTMAPHAQVSAAPSIAAPSSGQLALVPSAAAVKIDHAPAEPSRGAARPPSAGPTNKPAALAALRPAKPAASASAKPPDKEIPSMPDGPERSAE
jgi:serine/threonine-protein kinase